MISAKKSGRPILPRIHMRQFLYGSQEGSARGRSYCEINTSGLLYGIQDAYPVPSSETREIRGSTRAKPSSQTRTRPCPILPQGRAMYDILRIRNASFLPISPRSCSAHARLKETNLVQARTRMCLSCLRESSVRHFPHQKRVTNSALRALCTPAQIPRYVRCRLSLPTFSS